MKDQKLLQEHNLSTSYSKYIIFKTILDRSYKIKIAFEKIMLCRFNYFHNILFEHHIIHQCLIGLTILIAKENTFELQCHDGKLKIVRTICHK